MMMGKGEAIYKKAISNRHNRMIRYGRNIETKKKKKSLFIIIITLGRCDDDGVIDGGLLLTPKSRSFSASLHVV